MAALCRSYAAHPDAAAAAQILLDAGTPGSGIRVLTGEPDRDARDGAHGGFASTDAHAAATPVGRFAGDTSTAAAPMGAFAGDGTGRAGTFADADRETVTTYPGGVERMHIAGHARIKRLLLDAGLDEATAASDLERVHAGRVLLLVEVAQGDAERVAALLDA